MTPRFMVKYLYHEVATVNIIYHFCLENRARQTIITRYLASWVARLMSFMRCNHLSHIGEFPIR